MCTYPALSEQHVIVLTGLARGHTLAQVAECLGLSHEAMRSRLAGARQLLGAANQPHAVALAAHRGDLDLSTVAPDPARGRRSDIASLRARPLGARERLLLVGVAHGLTADEQALRLAMTRHAVASQVDYLLQRVGARTRAHAVALAYRYGVFLLDYPAPGERGRS